MKKNKPTSFLTLYFTCAILIFGAYQQSLMMINCDVSYALHVVQQLLTGKQYYTNFINTNPPLSFFIYTPTLLLTRLFPLNLFTALRIYIFSIIVFSIWIIHLLLKRLLSPQEQLLHSMLILGVAFSFTLLEVHEFGQRAHIAIMLLFPYLLLTALRTNKVKLKVAWPVVIGIIAGIGFALNPFYLFLLLFCELFLVAKKSSWPSIEFIIIIAIQVLYALVIFLFYPNYIHKIIPLAVSVYLPGYALSFLDLLSQPAILYSIVIFVIATTLTKTFRKNNLGLILMLANIAFLLSYLCQQKAFYYHELPLLTASTLLACYLLGELLMQYKQNQSPQPFLNKFDHLVFWPVMLLIFPLYYTFYTTALAYAYKFTTHLSFVRLINQISKPNDAILIMTYHTPMIYPTTQETNTVSASRFDSFWFFPALVKTPHNKHVQHYKKELIRITIEDIQNNKPRFILIDQSNREDYFGSLNFDYLAYFKRDQHFRKIFSRYKYLKTAQEYAIYQRPDL